MSIELHCPQCQKLIRAPDHAGGRRGKCPYCKSSVYIPTAPEEREEIGLAPLDEEDERRARQLRRESIQYAPALDHATDMDVKTDDAETLAGGAGAAPASGEVIDLAAEVGAFVRAMHESQLDDANAVVERLGQAGRRARDFVQGLVLDEMPPQFENIPQPLVQGFLKTLLDRLG